MVEYNIQYYCQLKLQYKKTSFFDFIDLNFRQDFIFYYKNIEYVFSRKSIYEIY